jgi:hypothetical protein
VLSQPPAGPHHGFGGRSWGSNTYRCAADNLRGYRILGGLCHTHHLLKQLEGWALSQLRPGIFEWVTPAGRRYAVAPDTHPA